MKKNQKNLKQITKTVIVLIMIFVFTLPFACKKDKDDKKDDPGTTKQYVLQIQNGAQTIGMDGSITYSAVIIGTDGVAIPATGVNWTTSDANIATISSNGAITIKSQGNITVSASTTYDGKTLTAKVPLGIMVPSIFAVAPSAIIYEKGGTLQLETVFFGSGTPSYTYSSDHDNIASVSSTGLVSFNAAGSCVITVTNSLQSNNPFYVPVLVIDAITIPLPVVRIAVSPAAHDMFRNDTKQFTAQAYNSSNQTVSETFTWTSLDPNIATVDANGLVRGVNIGSTYIQASAKGIIGQAEVIVNPDTVIVVEPYWFSIPPSGTKQFIAKAYNAHNNQLLPGITNFTWTIPTYGFPIFDIATVNSTGLVTVKSSAMQGMMTFVIANVTGNPELGGAALIMVGMASNCDCGAGNASVHHISVSNSQPINLSLMGGGVQLNVTAYDASNNVVPNPALVFCSDNIQAVNVDDTGLLMPVGLGDATIKICSGSYAETTITVHVGM